MKFKNQDEARSYFASEQLQTEVHFLKEHKITADELLYLKLLFFDKIELMFKLLGGEKFKVEERWTVDQINGLYRKGFLERKWNKLSDEYPDNNELTQEGYDLIAVALGLNPERLKEVKEVEEAKKKFIEDAGSELTKVYPNTVNGCPLKGYNEFTYKGKTYKGVDDLKKVYAEIIEYNPALHASIIHKVRQDSSQGYQVCNVAIVNFVSNRKWESIEDFSNTTDI